MFSWFNRIMIALIFALAFAGITLMVVDAQEGLNPPVDKPVQQSDDDCAACHTEFQAKWEAGHHGQSGSSPTFLADWERQGKPGACLVCHTTGYDPATGTWMSDGVSCLSCHVDEGGDHPKTPISTDNSPNLCGRCHSDTRFGWQDWEGSTHYARGMECTTCHDAHSASLKFTISRDGSGFTDASQLCITCHLEASMEFPYTKHHDEGVSCIGCHLEHLDTAEYAPHTVPDHSFSASLKTCNTCHSAQMHASAEAVNTSEVSPVADVQTNLPVVTAATPQPTPVSPMGYAGLAGLLGLAGGIVLAPWLEKFYRREVKPQHHKDDKNG
jgi:predicted CXXCH cytochrome family protein